MKLLVCLMSFIFLFILLFGVYGHYYFEINKSKSLPQGIYHISNETIKRNDIVVFCPPQNEFLEFAKNQGYWGNLKLACNNKTPKYMKKIVGIPYDNITVSLTGVYVNNHKIKNSEPYKKILSDKIFKNYSKSITLKDNEYFLMSDYSNLSFDSRYFGIVKESDILYKVIPFITYNK